MRLVVLDVDGVLTDGRLWIGPDGAEWKSFHVHDGLAMVRARAAGLVVAVVSRAAVRGRDPSLCGDGRDGGAPGSLGQAGGLPGPLPTVTAAGDEVVAAMGDDLADLPILTPRRPGHRAGRCRARGPAGRPVGHETARRRGAVREALEAILRAQDRWSTLTSGQAAKTLSQS